MPPFSTFTLDETVLGRVRRLDNEVRIGVPLGRPEIRMDAKGKYVI